MRVLVAMSGGVDSAVSAALLRDQGHEVEGVTLKLWGGESDSGCCSVSDVEDARSVAHRLGIEHHVFNYGEAFEENVVEPYVSAHFSGRTPNPCIECNRHVKFGRLLERAQRLGFDALATGHHARILRGRLLRGRDPDKDQSYVVSMLTPAELGWVIFPIGDLQKSEVRRLAAVYGLRVAGKADSQDVCFVQSRTAKGARARLLESRGGHFHPATVVDVRGGEAVGELPARELVTIGQRRGIGPSVDGGRRYVVGVDAAESVVFVGAAEDLLADQVVLTERTWTVTPARYGRRVEVQCSAHGRPVPAVVTEEGASFLEPARRVAPGQTVAIYDGDEVLGSGIAS
jgi:tRNA-uridine 2-sulfurtransferase